MSGVRFLAVLIAVSLFGLAAPVAAQTSKVDRESVTGSNIPRAVEYEPVEADRARQSIARFATCVYKRDPELVRRFLASGDPLNVDLAAAGLTSGTMDRKMGLATCLGREGLTDEIQMKLSLGTLHEMFTEPAYLAANPKPPGWLTQPIPDMVWTFASRGDDLMQASGIVEVGECMVRAAAVQSDAILRTTVASADELRAATALGPFLGACFFEGQSMTVSPASIRTWAASGLWHAQAARTTFSEAKN